MGSALNLLKEEINQASEKQHDLAKWKLGVTAALGAAAFGLAKDNNSPNYWLLLFVPFVCAYIDLYANQYQLRILVIARFLRTHPDKDAFLQQYEEECEQLRKTRQHTFSLGWLAGLGCSLAVSVSGVVFYFLDPRHDKYKETLLVSPHQAEWIWASGALFIICMWGYFQYQAGQISRGKSPVAQLM